MRRTLPTIVKVRQLTSLIVEEKFAHLCRDSNPNMLSLHIYPGGALIQCESRIVKSSELSPLSFSLHP